MSCLGYFAGHSPIHRLDPRARLLSALVLSVAVALSTRWGVMGWALGLSAMLAAGARLDVRPLARRLLHLNAFLLFLWVVLPWSVPEPDLPAAVGVAPSEAGARMALSITLKGNAIVLLFTALVATIDPQRLACTLKLLGLPDKLVHLLALTIRYTDVIHDEYSRLRRAMRARAFRPRFSVHTLRAFGYLTGLLLVRGMERAERVLAAMKCRGFDGRFLTLETFRFRNADRGMVLGALSLAGVWFWMERL